MFQDELIQEWMSIFDNLTSFSFMAFFDLTEDILQFLGKGLIARLMFMGEDGNLAIIHDTVDEETAKALGTYRGTSFTIIFPGLCEDYEALVKDTILEGLKFLRIKSEYLGITRMDDDYV